MLEIRRLWRDAIPCESRSSFHIRQNLSRKRNRKELLDFKRTSNMDTVYPPSKVLPSKRDLALFGLTPSKRDLVRKPRRRCIGGRGGVCMLGASGVTQRSVLTRFQKKKWPKKMGEKRKLAKKAYPPPPVREIFPA